MSPQPSDITTPDRWTQALDEHQPPELELRYLRRAVVLAAHPDDETLGFGGALHQLHRHNVPTTLVVASDGEAAYPCLGPDERAELGRVRRCELARALASAGLAALPVHWLGLPDSGLADHLAELTERLAEHLAGADAYFAPWTADPHPDHQAVGRAAAAAAPSTTYGWGYPIWMWPWMRPDQPEVRWDRARLLPLHESDLAAKLRARSCFRSQLEPQRHGQRPVLSAAMLAHSERPAELVFREPKDHGQLAWFAQLYADTPDPWSDQCWYERRKRAVVDACLPREDYRCGFEPGCGNGALTSVLAQRCARLLSSDPAPAAVARARRAVARHRHVQVEQSELPEGVPTEPIDLAVFSEVLYYLEEHAVDATLDATLRALVPGGDLVVVHWRGWPAEAPRDSIATARHVRAHPDLIPLIEHADEWFDLHVLRRA